MSEQTRITWALLDLLIGFVLLLCGLDPDLPWSGVWLWFSGHVFALSIVWFLTLLPAKAAT
jgi:hypothetical protein